MEFSEVVRRRRMVRRYAPDRPVPADLTERLVATALRSPSAGFSQGTSLLVLSEPDDRARFWSATSTGPGSNRWLEGMRTAPLLIMVWAGRVAYLDRYAEADKGWTDRDEQRWAAPFWYVDAGMATMNLLLAVVDANDTSPVGSPGLGACFFGVPPTRVDAVRDAFGVPVDQLVVGVVSVGFRAEDEAPSGSPRTRDRRPPADLVHRGRW